FTPGDNAVNAFLSDYSVRSLEIIKEVQTKLDLIPIYAPYIPSIEEKYPQMLMAIEEIDQLTNIQSEIKQYVRQTVSNWSVRAGVEKEWDDFQSQLKEVSVDDYVRIHKEAYDRTK